MSARPSSTSRRAWALVGALAVVSGLLLTASTSTAQAAAGDVGTPGPSTSGAGKGPTGEKPESKLWFNDGRWWASMFDASSQTWHIAVQDRTTSAWSLTPTRIDDRPDSRADTAWLNGKLYVASHVKAASSAENAAGQPARVYRYSYTAAGGYTLDQGFPVAVNDVSSETLVFDRDSAGRLWTTWTQGSSVYVNATVTPGNDTVWGTPFVLPATGGTGLASDDISTLVEYAGKIGVLWSSQPDGAVRFAPHLPGDPVGTWGSSVAITVPGAGQADDHLNIKSLQGDATGRVFVVIKTSLDANGPSAPSIVVLARSAAGEWTRATFGTNADCHTRPVLLLDSTNQLLHVYATAPDSGCAYTGSAGSIFEKTSPLSALSLAPGRGTPVMRDTTSANLNNVTASKQTVSSITGISLLASDDVAQRYWSSYQPITAPAPAPSPSTTPSPTTSPTPAPATETVLLEPAADGQVLSASPDTNYGKDAALTVDSGPDVVSYIRFDARAYAGRKLRGATLRLHVGANASAGNQAVKFVADDVWKEALMTWRDAPARGATLATLGATQANTTYALTLPVSTVQGELGGKLSVGLDTTSTDGLILTSRETGTPPELVLVMDR
ncbi:MAG: hypothetical protein JWM64_1123 [Frankiales bacterium]|nr:hypothetical protein [Frankiales bacterium]